MKPYYETERGKLYHGNCLDILPNLPQVELVLTDPPYGIGFASQPTKWQRRAGQVAEQWDESPSEQVMQLLAVGNHQVIWGGNYYPLPVSRGWLSWYKPDAPPSMGAFELAWTNRDTTAKQIICTISSVNAERVGHPTQKPLAVMLWSLKLFDAPGVVFDPFSGSGTTAVACERLNRQWIGIEIEERYCEMAARRIENERKQLRLFANF